LVGALFLFRARGLANLQGTRCMMVQTFDPYQKWLGISAKDQPPNHYRLLGIDLFETDLDAIANVADQRRLYVCGFQTGENSALAQRILDEIVVARECLLNPQKKAEYDRQLRATFASVSRCPVPSPLARNRSAARRIPLLFIRAAGISAAAALLLVFYAVSRNDEKNADKAATLPILQNPPSSVPPKIEPKPKLRKSIAWFDPDSKRRPESEAARPKVTAPSDPKAQGKPEGEVKPEDAPAAEPKPAPHAKELPKAKLSVPAPVALEKALATVRDIYREDYRKPDKAALAKKLIQTARETKDSADRFALLQEAKDVAAEDWQGDLAFEAIDAMANDYEISRAKMKAEVIQKSAGKTRLAPEQRTAIAEAALGVIDEAIREDNFEIAERLAKRAKVLARSSKDKELIQKTAAKTKEVETAAKAYTGAREAMKVLKEKPTDPDANMVVGKYQCFVKGDWEKGLPMLALGSDEALKSLAKKDLAGARAAEEQVTLGDGWWDADGRERAVHWYSQALPGLNGLEKARVGKRVPVVTKPTADFPVPGGNLGVAVNAVA
jgi:hypothetical protein